MQNTGAVTLTSMTALPGVIHELNLVKEESLQR